MQIIIKTLMFFAVILCAKASADDLIVVTRKTCPPCQKLKKDLLKFPEMTRGHSVKLLESKADMARYGVDSVPTIIRIRNGKEIDRHVGYGDPKTLIEWLRK